jgi:hypothetical protein
MREDAAADSHVCSWVAMREDAAAGLGNFDVEIKQDLLLILRLERT